MFNRPALLTLADGTQVTTPQDFDAILRPVLSRTVALTNHKGGIGKTPLTVNIAARLAGAPAMREAGVRFLVVDCDPQANASDDLGVGRSIEGGDEGEALANSLKTGEPLQVLRDVRDGLDLAVGGAAISHINGSYFANVSQYGEQYAKTRLAVALAAVAHQYDVIVIDTPPSGTEILRQCFVAASWALVPVNWDYAGQKGFNGVFNRMGEAQDLNPSLNLLGVVLYGFPRVSGIAAEGQGGQRGGARGDIEAILKEVGVSAPVFPTVISQSPSIAETVRKRGELAHELIAYAREGAASLTLDIGNGQSRKITHTDMSNCVQEFGQVTAEVYHQLNYVTGRV